MLRMDTVIDMVGNVKIGLRARNGLVTFQVNDETPTTLTPKEAGDFMVALNATILEAIQQK